MIKAKTYLAGVDTSVPLPAIDEDDYEALQENSESEIHPLDIQVLSHKTKVSKCDNHSFTLSIAEVMISSLQPLALRKSWQTKAS